MAFVCIGKICVAGECCGETFVGNKKSIDDVPLMFKLREQGSSWRILRVLHRDRQVLSVFIERDQLRLFCLFERYETKCVRIQRNKTKVGIGIAILLRKNLGKVLFFLLP